MDILATLAGDPVAPALLAAVIGRFVLDLLSLVSARVNTHAVRLAKAKRKHK